MAQEVFLAAYARLASFDPTRASLRTWLLTIARNGCLNARTVRAEAHFFLNEYVPDASLAVLHIYFPDPWPKKRHHKRRLIQPKFMPTVMRILKPGEYRYEGADLGILVTRGRSMDDRFRLTERARKWIDGIRSHFAVRSLSLAKAEPEVADPAFKIL